MGNGRSSEVIFENFVDFSMSKSDHKLKFFIFVENLRITKLWAIKFKHQSLFVDADKNMSHGTTWLEAPKCAWVKKSKNKKEVLQSS